MKKIRRFIPLIGYYGLIFYLSSRPSFSFHPFPLSDKFFHIIEYIPLGFFVMMAWVDKKWVIPALVSVLILAVLDEFHQSFVSGRHSEVFDAVADCVGGGIGIYSYNFLKRLNDGEEGDRG